MSNATITERLTPQKVAQTLHCYSIPIYQRLFEWDDFRITQLLNDLYQAYCKSKDRPYYVGMLTSNTKNELIDGQQRFTVLMLLGIVLSRYEQSWNRFLFIKAGQPRLYFTARPNDNTFLCQRCAPNAMYENFFMREGICCIQDYMDKMEEQSREPFAKFVFENLSFFVSVLPTSYAPKALNKYFETMNSTGKNLENHEILKVKLLQDDTHFDKVQLTRLWNAVADMDQPLITRRKEEKQGEVQERYQIAYDALASLDLNRLFQSNCLNALSAVNTEGFLNFPIIGDIAAKSEKPTQQRLSRNSGYRSILSFSEFLLQVLWLQLTPKEQQTVIINNFFDVNKMQETFQQYRTQIRADKFIISLMRYRLLFDRYVINVSNENSEYDLVINDNGIDNAGNSYHENLLMYESMLYVNASVKSYHLWLPSLLARVDMREKVTCQELYNHIKQQDELRHPFLNIADGQRLSYPDIDRYWFWKLDFYLWKNRNNIFEDEFARKVANNYSFRRNRSVEHIAPQTPEIESTLRLSPEVENSFGNLVMISSGQNSSLHNSTYEVKRAKVQSYISKELNGTIESLKMLLIYQHKTWDEDTIFAHQQLCMEFLRLSFG